MVAMPVGLILSGIFAQWLGVEKWFSILGALALLLAILSLRVPSLHSWDKADEDIPDAS
jgi:DHA3 family macrolide efflux protein-like MFS transporter